MASKLQKKRPPLEVGARDVKPESLLGGAEYESIARPSSAKSIGASRPELKMEIPTKPISAFVEVDLRQPHNQRQPVNNSQLVAGEAPRARSQPPPYQRARYQQQPLTHLGNNSSSANLATVETEAVSSGIAADTPSSRKCRSCGKHRIVSSDTSQAGDTSTPTGLRISQNNEIGQSTSAQPATGSSTCKSCGKRSSPTPPKANQHVNTTNRSMPQALADAHTRPASDGTKESVSSTPMPPRSQTRRPAPKPPGMAPHVCRCCGKERRPQTSATASQNLLGEKSSRQDKLSESWPLPPTRSHAVRSISQPVIQKFAPGNATNHRPQVSDKEAYYISERRLPSQPPRNDLPATSTVGSIFRRISNAVRPAYTRSRTSVDRLAKKPQQTYVRLSETEPSPRPGSSYSFDESSVEMLPVASRLGCRATVGLPPALSEYWSHGHYRGTLPRLRRTKAWRWS